MTDGTATDWQPIGDEYYEEYIRDAPNLSSFERWTQRPNYTIVQWIGELKSGYWIAMLFRRVR